MFELSKPEPYKDSALGIFESYGGFWRGSISAYGTALKIPLVLAGNRKVPDVNALFLAHEIPNIFPHPKSIIENALFEHYCAYVDALASGALSFDKAMPDIGGAEQVWSHVFPEFVSILHFDGMLSI